MSRVFPRLLGTFGSGILVVMSGRTSRDVPSCPRTSWDFWTWGFGSCVWSIGHPGMSRVVPGLLRTLGPGTLVVVSGRTSRDVPSIPKTSWDFWTWDFGSCVWYIGHPGMSRVVPGLLGTFGHGTLVVSGI